MLYLVALISALIVGLCIRQLLRDRQRRIERSKPIGSIRRHR